MAGRGPAPNDPTKRKGNDRTFAMTELPAKPAVKAPPLPKLRTLDENGKTILVSRRPETIRWYKGWAGSPQASMFIGTDWERLHMLANLVDGFHLACAHGEFSKASALFAEIRLNEQKLGATPEDRQRLRWKIGEPETSDEPRETSRRSRPDPRLIVMEGGKAG